MLVGGGGGTFHGEGGTRSFLTKLTLYMSFEYAYIGK